MPMTVVIAWSQMARTPTELEAILCVCVRACMRVCLCVRSNGGVCPSVPARVCQYKGQLVLLARGAIFTGTVIVQGIQFGKAQHVICNSPSSQTPTRVSQHTPSLPVSTGFTGKRTRDNLLYTNKQPLHASLSSAFLHTHFPRTSPLTFLQP
jgi:hypothetical protein